LKSSQQFHVIWLIHRSGIWALKTRNPQALTGNTSDFGSEESSKPRSDNLRPWPRLFLSGVFVVYGGKTVSKKPNEFGKKYNLKAQGFSRRYPRKKSADSRRFFNVQDQRKSARLSAQISGKQNRLQETKRIWKEIQPKSSRFFTTIPAKEIS
jgi:hypothetical protein